MPKFVLQDQEHIEGALKLKEYVQSTKQTLGRAAEGRLIVPEHIEFAIGYADKRYNVVAGAKVFTIMRNSDVIYVTLDTEYVQVRFDFTVDPPEVSTKGLDSPSNAVARRAMGVSYISSAS